MSTALTQTKAAPLVDVIEKSKGEFARSLPDYINPESFVRSVRTAIGLNPDLNNANPRTVISSCMKAAQDGLIIDGREAALIIRNVNVGTKENPKWEKQATYQPMVQGLMKLARNSGEISSITAQVVYANDKFLYALGDNEHIEHEPAGLTVEQGEPIAAYAIVRLKDGTTVREVMRKSAILNIGAQGTNGFQYDPAKGKNYAEWWRKTVLRRITKFIPRSSDAIGRMTQAVERIDEDFEFAPDEANEPAPVAKKERGGAAARLRDVTPEAKETVEQHDPVTGEIDMGSADKQDGDDI